MRCAIHTLRIVMFWTSNAVGRRWCPERLHAVDRGDGAGADHGLRAGGRSRRSMATSENALPEGGCV
ncbi:hypothetical protein STRIP9103_03188 [Streptomyces ipomoeae 91-03]|uniref:Uncharacterized protein n=1 Tax=Streptomyces ipomoeae 91-03 TaxID=698759 RepID=L1L526_9ACTN|nr:hypothetical protein STRIP9103_03188 [Streptomyces ipomoeae 91-03]